MAASICATIPSYKPSCYDMYLSQSVWCLSLLVHWVTGEQSQIEQSSHALNLVLYILTWRLIFHMSFFNLLWHPLLTWPGLIFSSDNTSLLSSKVIWRMMVYR
jgi:hypothetical protein